MFGRTGGFCLLLSAPLAACGGPTDLPDAELVINESAIQVWAEPPSSDFLTNTEVVLNTTEPGSRIYYTLDGSDPSSDDARPYDGPIPLAESTLITFIARTPARLWSKPRSEFYVSRPELEAARGPLERDLWVESESVFMAARVGSKDLVVRRIKLRSVGLQQLTIHQIVMTANPAGWSFFQEGTFSYEILTEATEFPLHLAPGETLELEIYYRPTKTFSSAAILIESDAQRDDGHQLIELWGRLLAW